MKLKRLWIDGFKNLNDFELDFTDKDGITVLIGNNGSGKSNVIEAISSIFTGLFKMATPQRKPKFEYEIEYELNNTDNYKFTLKKYDGDYRYDFLKNGEQILVKDMKSTPDAYLPSKIISIYSGEDMKLWDEYYKHLYHDFLSSVKSNELRTLPKYRLFYVDSDYWNEALLTLIFSELENNKIFIKDYLKIETIKNIRFSFDKKKIVDFSQNIVVDFVKRINPNMQDNINISLDNFKQLMEGEYEYGLFIKLVAATLSGLIQDIKIIFNNELNINSLSEGEKKQLLLRLVLEVLADENTLVLMDEPDANIHVANKIQIKTMLEEYPNRENILTTHSPTLTHSFGDKHISMIIDGKIEDKNKQDIFSEISDGIWNYQEQNIFLSSTKDVILLVEGKHDKAHILEAFKRFKNEYDGLDFDTFFADGANNLKQLVLGFSTSDLKLDNKKVIAIFDDDDDGRKGRGQQNFKIVGNNEKIYCLKSNEKFYGILLPKQDTFSGEFTIENMYLPVKFKEAMQYAFANRQTQDGFFNTGINEISKKIREDAKNRLADDCKNFEDEDFKHFKRLFDLIKEIKELP